MKKKGRGQIINHSSHNLYVLETDSGRPIVHILGPKMKSPSHIDADGFKRADGKTIFTHKGWWKVPDSFKANIYQIGRSFIVPVSVMLPVSDKHFDEYIIQNNKSWGEKLVYVNGIIKNQNGKTTGYLIEGRGKVGLKEAIKLAKQEKIDNVVVVRKKDGSIFLRSKRNEASDDNLRIYS